MRKGRCRHTLRFRLLRSAARSAYRRGRFGVTEFILLTRLYQFTLSLHIIEGKGKLDSTKMARKLELEITESSDYLEKTLKHTLEC